MKTPTEYSFNTLSDVIKAAIFWYGSSEGSFLHEAELRLMKGEKPE